MPRRGLSKVSPMPDMIDRGRCTAEHPVPLLFIHGAAHGAWCWDEHFLEFFADRGCRAVAVNLRGRGRNPTSSQHLRDHSLADYVEDVVAVADTLPTRPVVIGHSMGGFVVQKYLERYDAPAGVLMASIPARGAGAALLRKTRLHPWLTARAAFTGNQLCAVATPKLARETFFSPQTPEADVVRYAQRLNEESPRAVFDSLFRLPDPTLVTTPLLVLGAHCDGNVTANEVRATARAYGTEAEFIPDVGHNMMLEPSWATVAQRIHSWLGTHGL